MIYCISTLLSLGQCLNMHVVWHHNLTASQSDELESLQKRALQIIHDDFVVGKSYEFLVSFSKTEPLFEKRTIGKTFFNKMCHKSNCLNYLLPYKRDPQVFEKM